jgi:hypothetical protein
MTHCLFYHPCRARGVRSHSDCIVIDGAAVGKVIFTGCLPLAQSEAGVRPVGGIAGERWRAGRDRRGVDATEQGEIPGESLEGIAGRAVMAVLAEGRIEKSSVDGLITRKAPLTTRVVMTRTWPQPPPRCVLRAGAGWEVRRRRCCGAAGR